MKDSALHPNQHSKGWTKYEVPRPNDHAILRDHIIDYNKAKICFYLTLFIDFPKLWVPKSSAMLLSIIHLPSFQIVEQFPCPGIIEHRNFVLADKMISS